MNSVLKTLILCASFYAVRCYAAAVGNYAVSGKGYDYVSVNAKVNAKTSLRFPTSTSEILKNIS